MSDKPLRFKNGCNKKCEVSVKESYVWFGTQQLNSGMTCALWMDARQMDALCRRWMKTRKKKL